MSNVDRIAKFLAQHGLLPTHRAPKGHDCYELAADHVLGRFHWTNLQGETGTEEVRITSIQQAREVMGY